MQIVAPRGRDGGITRGSTDERPTPRRGRGPRPCARARRRRPRPSRRARRPGTSARSCRCRTRPRATSQPRSSATRGRRRRPLNGGTFSFRHSTNPAGRTVCRSTRQSAHSRSTRDTPSRARSRRAPGSLVSRINRMGRTTAHSAVHAVGLESRPPCRGSRVTHG